MMYSTSAFNLVGSIKHKNDWVKQWPREDVHCVQRKSKIISLLTSQKTKNKKTRDHYSPDKEPEEHEILTALSMSQDPADQFQQILKKLEKIDTIELSLKKTESKLKNLPYCVKFW